MTITLETLREKAKHFVKYIISDPEHIYTACLKDYTEIARGTVEEIDKSLADKFDNYGKLFIEKGLLSDAITKAEKEISQINHNSRIQEALHKLLAIFRGIVNSS